MTSRKQIFVCYRRDEAGLAGPLAESLRRDFNDNVFFDRTALRGGDEWRKKIIDAITYCRVFLIVIGPDWHPERLFEDGDFSAFEIAMALKTQARVIPVLIGRASLPTADALPESLRSVLDKHVAHIDADRWSEDYRKLAAIIRASLPNWRWLWWILLLILAIAAVVYFALPHPQPPPQTKPVAQRTTKTTTESPPARPAPPLEVPPKDVPADALHGIDIQHEHVDWNKVSRSDVAFVYVHFAQKDRKDFMRLWGELEEKDIRRGADVNFSLDLEVAREFGQTLRSRPDDLPPVVDFEPRLMHVNEDANALAGHLRNFLDAVQQATGRRPVIYTTPREWTSIGKDPRLTAQFASYPLWIGFVAPGSTPQTLAPWTTWTLWQQCLKCDVAGIKAPTHVDVFNGSVGAWRGFLRDAIIKR